MPLAAVFQNSEHADSYDDASFVLDTTGVVIGDLMVVVLGTSENSSGDVALTPTGWTQAENVNWDAGASNSYLGVWWKLALADAPSETFTFTAGRSIPHTGVFFKVTGVKSVPPLAASTAIDGDNDQTHGIANVAYLAGDLVVAAYISSHFSVIQDITAGPTGFTQLAKLKNSTINVMSKNMAVYSLAAVSGGSTSGLTVTTDQFPRDTRSIVFLIPKALPSGGGGGMGLGFGIGF